MSARQWRANVACQSLGGLLVRHVNCDEYADGVITDGLTIVAPEAGTQPLPAAQLREAAALMRSRAKDAARLRPAPWVVAADGVAAGVWSESKARLAADSDYESVAEHIASWHPAVALAVADWLESEAVTAEHFQSLYDDKESKWAKTWDPSNEAVTVARAYLGSNP